MSGRKIIVSAFLLAAMIAGGAAQAAPCRIGGHTQRPADFEREAMAQGVSQRTIATAAPFLTYDQRIVNIDHGQRVFTQTFLEFSDRMAAVADGKPLPAENLPASLLLLDGTVGLALVYQNFQVYLQRQQLTCSIHDGCLSRDPHRRHPAASPRQSVTGAAFRRYQSDAGHAGSCRL